MTGPGPMRMIVFGAEDCALPLIAGAQLVRCSDPARAWRYAMTTSTGLIGPGPPWSTLPGSCATSPTTLSPARSERIHILVTADCRLVIIGGKIVSGGMGLRASRSAALSDHRDGAAV